MALSSTIVWINGRHATIEGRKCIQMGSNIRFFVFEVDKNDEFVVKLREKYYQLCTVDKKGCPSPESRKKNFSQEEAEMQARGERVNRDGDVIDIAKEEAALEAVALFETVAEPDAEAIVADASAETPAEDAAAVDNAEEPSV